MLDQQNVDFLLIEISPRANRFFWAPCPSPSPHKAWFPLDRTWCLVVEGSALRQVSPNWRRPSSCATEASGLLSSVRTPDCAMAFFFFSCCFLAFLFFCFHVGVHPPWTTLQVRCWKNSHPLASGSGLTGLAGFALLCGNAVCWFSLEQRSK